MSFQADLSYTGSTWDWKDLCWIAADKNINQSEGDVEKLGPNNDCMLHESCSGLVFESD